MVTRYGMHEVLGQVAYETAGSAYLGQSDPRWLNGPGYSQETAWRIDAAVLQLVEAAYQRARDILECNRGELDRIAEQLLAQETLDADDLPQKLSLPGVSAPVEPEAETVT
jgi:cell division protease FtsH